MRLKLLSIYCSVGIIMLVLYGALYVELPFREQGRWRGMETYVFCRDFCYNWEVYAFVPAGYVESVLVRFWPKAFLSNPTWADSDYPRLVLIKSDTTRVRFSASKQKQHDD